MVCLPGCSSSPSFSHTRYCRVSLGGQGRKLGVTDGHCIQGASLHQVPLVFQLLTCSQIIDPPKSKICTIARIRLVVIILAVQMPGDENQKHVPENLNSRICTAPSVQIRMQPDLLPAGHLVLFFGFYDGVGHCH